MSDSRRGREFIKLSEVNLGAVRWVKAGKLESQLISEGKLVGTLKWASSRGSLATAESAEGTWTFKRAGFLRPRMTIREQGSESDLAVMPVSWAVEGGLRFSDGRGFLVGCSSLWHSDVTVSDSQGRRLMLLRPDPRARGGNGSIQIDKTALDDIPGASLLAAFGVYLVLMVAGEDAHGGTIAALVAAGAI